MKRIPRKTFWILVTLGLTAVIMGLNIVILPGMVSIWEDGGKNKVVQVSEQSSMFRLPDERLYLGEKTKSYLFDGIKDPEAEDPDDKAKLQEALEAVELARASFEKYFKEEIETKSFECMAELWDFSAASPGSDMMWIIKWQPHDLTELMENETLGSPVLGYYSYVKPYIDTPVQCLRTIAFNGTADPVAVPTEYINSQETWKALAINFLVSHNFVKSANSLSESGISSDGYIATLRYIQGDEMLYEIDVLMESGKICGMEMRELV